MILAKYLKPNTQILFAVIVLPVVTKSINESLAAGGVHLRTKSLAPPLTHNSKVAPSEPPVKLEIVAAAVIVADCFVPTE